MSYENLLLRLDEHGRGGLDGSPGYSMAREAAAALREVERRLSFWESPDFKQAGEAADRNGVKESNRAWQAGYAQSQRDGAAKYLDSILPGWREFHDKKSQAEARVRVLEEALRNYTRHARGCAINYHRVKLIENCDCGLREILHTLSTDSQPDTSEPPEVVEFEDGVSIDGIMYAPGTKPQDVGFGAADTSEPEWKKRMRADGWTFGTEAADTSSGYDEQRNHCDACGHECSRKAINAEMYERWQHSRDGFPEPYEDYVQRMKAEASEPAYAEVEGEVIRCSVHRLPLVYGCPHCYVAAEASETRASDTESFRDMSEDEIRETRASERYEDALEDMADIIAHECFHSTNDDARAERAAGIIGTKYVRAALSGDGELRERVRKHEELAGQIEEWLRGQGPARWTEAAGLLALAAPALRSLLGRLGTTGGNEK